VLDDPIQAMDPAKVEGFVEVIQKIAVDRQVIVLSHDDRLPAAVRRSGLMAQIYEVTQGCWIRGDHEKRVPSVDALPRRRFRVRQGRERARRGQESGDPGPCRMGLETTAHEVYSTRSYTAGLDRLTVETRWEETSTVRQKLAFALYSDKNASIEAWLKGGSRRSAAFHVCNNGVHAGSTRDRADEVNAVRAAVKDLQQTVT
jgi:hypothetical protein